MLNPLVGVALVDVALRGSMIRPICRKWPTFCINSLVHVSGSKRYVTGDDFRNNALLAFFTLGEGWHNNHHAYQSSVRQGFHWRKIDLTYYTIKALSWIGVVWGLKVPPMPYCATSSASVPASSIVLRNSWPRASVPKESCSPLDLRCADLS